MKWIAALMVEVTLNMIAMLIAAGVFLSGVWVGSMNADYRHSRDDSLRVAQREHLAAQTAYTRKLTESLDKTIPGPEVYTPAEDVGPGVPSRASGSSDAIDELPEPTPDP